MCIYTYMCIHIQIHLICMKNLENFTGVHKRRQIKGEACHVFEWESNIKSVNCSKLICILISMNV